MADASFQVSGNIVDIHRRRIFPGTVVVVDGGIEKITEMIGEAAGSFATWLAPGFVDAHVHIESSMLVPSEFARLATVHGIVGTVSDPHEIANGLGVAGIRYMVE